MSNIEKYVSIFNGANWPHWSSQMKDFLSSTSPPLWLYVNGTYAIPTGPPALPETATSQKTAEHAALVQEHREQVALWEEKDMQARALTRLRLSDPIKQSVEERETSKETWAALKELYGQESHSRNFGIFRQAITFRLSGNDPTPEFTKLGSLFTQLQAQKLEVPHTIQCMILLAGLPAKWNHLSTMILTNSGQNQLSWTTCTQAIANEFAKERNVDKKGKAQANPAISAVKRQKPNPQWQIAGPLGRQQPTRSPAPQPQAGPSQGPKRQKKRGGKNQRKPRASATQVASALTLPEDGYVTNDYDKDFPPLPPPAAPITVVNGRGTVVTTVAKPMGKALVERTRNPPPSAAQAFTGLPIGGISVFPQYAKARKEVAQRNLPPSAMNLRIAELDITSKEKPRFPPPVPTPRPLAKKRKSPEIDTISLSSSTDDEPLDWGSDREGVDIWLKSQVDKRCEHSSCCKSIAEQPEQRLTTQRGGLSSVLVAMNYVHHHLESCHVC